LSSLYYRTTGGDDLDEKLDSMAGMSSSALPRPAVTTARRRQLRESARQADLNSSSSECPSLPRHRSRIRYQMHTQKIFRDLQKVVFIDLYLWI
jgi:hypothetical protein